MAKQTKSRKTIKVPKDKLLARLTISFFDRPLMTAVVWISLVVFGIFSYTTLLRREGFPSVNIPLTIVSGTYFVNDPAKVDADVAKPISDIALKRTDVTAVQTQSADNFFGVSIQFSESTDAKEAASQIETAVKQSKEVPDSAQIRYNVPHFGATGGDTEQIDVAVSFYDTTGKASAAELAKKAEAAATVLREKNIDKVKSVTIKNPFQQVVDPATGQQVTVQQTFDRFGLREDNKVNFYNSVVIAVAAEEGFDIITLDEAVREASSELNAQSEFKGYKAAVSASFAPEIEDNISELQKVLIEGLIAVLIVGSIVIAIRASLITVISMITVLVATMALLYLIGYTLNVITLFALILSLALIVDDTIIMVEAIDAARHHNKDRRKTVAEATRKVSRAMVAATLTAALSFAPLIFVGGILGSFIRAIPVTIIAALLISLIVALIFIPYFARFLLLGKKQMGAKAIVEVAAGFEEKLANFIAAPMIWARNSKKKLFGVGLTAVFVGIGFIFAGLVIARNVVFNIFPPTKDSNGLIVTLNFAPNTKIDDAQKIAVQADKVIADVLGDNFVQSAYFGSGGAQSATSQIEIVSYTKRDVKAPQLVQQIQQRLSKDVKNVQASVGQLDVGPPASSFIVQLKADDRQAAFKGAQDLAAYLRTLELTRTNGTTARLVNVAVSSPNQYLRDEGQLIATVSAGFDADDTSTLVTLAQNKVEGEFNTKKLATYGLKEGSITVDLGQESENQDSFQSLVAAFPALLVVMYVLLAFQFRSFLQPLLIFMAIPFSIFGVMLGLDITNNAISFFTMMGFFALVGLSIKNTILLTDFANQARRAGHSAIDSAVAALRERFRPLFATSVTAVVSLIPLAITSPFWEGLAYVIIFGVLSSTFLVVTVFPYYYLGAEYLRLKIAPKHFFAWLIATLAVVVIVSRTISVSLGLMVIPLSLLLVIFQSFYKQRLARG